MRVIDSYGRILERLISLTMLLHHAQEFHNHLTAWADQNLPLARFFGIVD